MKDLINKGVKAEVLCLRKVWKSSLKRKELQGWFYDVWTFSKSFKAKLSRPVGWGCRIRRLQYPPPPMRPPVGRGWQPVKALGRIPGGWAVIDPMTVWSMACNTPLWPLLGLTGGRIGPDPINRLVMSSRSTYIFYPDHTFKSAPAASS